LDTRRIRWIFVAGIGTENVGTGALEKAEGEAPPRVIQRLDGGVRVLWRVLDLRDVMHRCDAVVELTEPTKQLVDVDVLRPVHRGKLQQNEFEVGCAPTRRV